MDFRIDFIGCIILYFKGSQVRISMLRYISVTKDCFNLSKQCRPRADKMKNYVYAAFHLGLHHLQKYPFTRGFQYTKGYFNNHSKGNLFKYK